MYDHFPGKGKEKLALDILTKLFWRRSRHNNILPGQQQRAKQNDAPMLSSGVEPVSVSAGEFGVGSFAAFKF